MEIEKSEFGEWLESQADMASAWDACQRADLMLLALCRIGGYEDSGPLRLFAVWCARRLQCLKDPRSLAALDVVERYAAGTATREELAAAASATRLAYESYADEYSFYAASAAYESYEYTYAECTAVQFAYAAAADAAAADAANAAFGAARNAAAAGSDARARAEAHRTQADKLRQLVRNPWR